MIITPFIITFAHSHEELVKPLRPVEFIVDISWTIEIFFNFIEADYKHRTFSAIALNYLKFWFWIDAISTFPCLIYLENRNDLALLKMLRVLHIMELFSPFKLLLKSCLMKKNTKKEIEHIYSLTILFFITWLFAHFCACFWITLGYQREDSWIRSNIDSNYDNIWGSYGPYEIYVVSIYWILEVLTTVGYGDFFGSTIEEMLFSICLEFGGLLFFSALTGLIIKYAVKIPNFTDQLYEYETNNKIWIMRLEKALDFERATFMPHKLYRSIEKYTELAFKYDFNLIIESADFYQTLRPQDQTRLIKTLFIEFRRNFRPFFDPCE